MMLLFSSLLSPLHLRASSCWCCCCRRRPLWGWKWCPHHRRRRVPPLIRAWRNESSKTTNTGSGTRSQEHPSVFSLKKLYLIDYRKKEVMTNIERTVETLTRISCAASSTQATGSDSEHTDWKNIHVECSGPSVASALSDGTE